MGKTISLHLNKNRKVSGIFIYLFIYYYINVI
jgi:hypothetical protein